MKGHDDEGPPSGPTPVDRDVVETIEALGSRQRLEILVVLAERKYDLDRETNAMRFTELYDAVDCQSSSQFSYHLDRLVDTFIVETPDGYQLTYAGDKVQRAIFSGLYESPRPLVPTDVDGTCPACGERALEACSENDRFVVRCTSCEVPVVTDLFPRSVSRGRTPREIVDCFGYSIWAKFVFVRGNVCPECYGRVETRLEPPDQRGTPFAVAVSECQECRFTVHMPVAVYVAFHPVVVEGFWQRGVSLLDLPLWELFQYTTGDEWDVAIVSREPFVAHVTITLDTVTLRLTVDGSRSPMRIEPRE